MTKLPELATLKSLLTEIIDTEVMSRFTRVSSQTKSDGSVVTEADLITQARIHEALQAAWPEIPLLGEEMEREEQQELLSSAEYLWCLDPLDGSSNFAAGIPFFCSSLALLHHGRAVLGIIYDPIKRECFSAELGRGAWLNDQPLQLTDDHGELSTSIACVDLKRLGFALASQVAVAPPFRSQRNFGSGALDWAWLACGRSQLYLHGGQQLWDYVAGHLIFSEAGGVCSDLLGQPVPNQNLYPRPIVAAGNQSLHAQWLAWVEQASRVEP